MFIQIIYFLSKAIGDIQAYCPQNHSHTQNLGNDGAYLKSIQVFRIVQDQENSCEYEKFCYDKASVCFEFHVFIDTVIGYDKKHTYSKIPKQAGSIQNKWCIVKESRTCIDQ